MSGVEQDYAVRPSWREETGHILKMTREDCKIALY